MRCAVPCGHQGFLNARYKPGNLLTADRLFAFISYIQQLQKDDLQLIDCQVYTEHLESLGARMIPRSSFINLLNRYIL